MNHEPHKTIDSVEQQIKLVKQKQMQQSIQQIAVYIIIAFVNYLLIDFNSTWLFGITFSPLYATLLSFVFIRIGIPLAVLGYALTTSGASFPLIPLNVS